MQFIDKVKKFKNGNKHALDDIFKVIFDKKTHGISKILINDDELTKNYSSIMKKYQSRIPYDELNQLFHFGLIESIYKMKEYRSNQEALAFVQNGILLKIKKFIDQTKGQTGLKNYQSTDDEGKSNDEIITSLLDQKSYQQYFKQDCPSKIDEFLKDNSIEGLLTKAQFKVWQAKLKHPMATDAEIGNMLNFSQQNVNKIWHSIRDKLNDCFDVFVKLNQHNTTRLTSEIIDFLDHVHKLKKYYGFATDDERLFPETFDFIKRQYLYINQSDFKADKLFENKKATVTTIDNVLTDNWTAGNRPSKNAQVALRKLEQAIMKNDIFSINKRDRKRLVQHVIVALERFLMKNKKAIEENAKINRLKREKLI